MIGKTISHYKIIETLGEGGMGIVYKAEDLKLGRPVAIKFLSSHMGKDGEEKKRFMHEAKAASALEHSNICNIHEIDETEDGQMYIVMAFYEGETLRRKIDRGPLELDKSIDIAIQIANGLTKAHDKVIIHRDIKPANLFITSDEEVKILDFGLAKLSGQSKLTKEGTTLGTVAYMSPEQARGDMVDHRSDIWSVGIVLYEMISGQKPFKGDYEQAMLYSIINELPRALTALRTGVPLELERIVNKALAKNADERYQHMDELLVDLKRFIKDSDSSIPVQSGEHVKKASPKKKPMKIVIGSSIVLSVIIIFFMGRYLFIEEMPLTEPKPIVVISFKNQTGDKTYDYLQEAIPNLLITSLEQSRYLRVITWERMYDLLNQLGRDNVAIIDEELGFELCRLEGVEAIILGSFIKAGDIFATDVKVLDVQSKSLLKSVSSKGEGVGSILQNQIDELSQAISSSVGIPERALGGTQLKISDITTPSMEAYNYFLRGREDYDKMYYADARKFLEKAVQLDSTFAVAYLYLALTNDNLGNHDDRDYYYQEAKKFSQNVSDKDRLYIEAYYARRIEKDPDKRFQILNRMVEKYPKEKRIYFDLGIYYDSYKLYDKAIVEYNNALELDPDYGPVHNQLAYLYGDLENFDKANEHLQKYTSLLPGDANPFDSMAEFYLRMGKMDESIIKYKEAVEAKPDFGSERKLSFIYGMLENYTEAIHWADIFIKNAPSIGIKSSGYWLRGLMNYRQGNIKQGLLDIKECVDLAKIVGYKFAIAFSDWLRAWIFLDRSDFDKSKRLFDNYYDYRKKNSPQYLSNYKSDRAFFYGLLFLKQSKIDSAKYHLQEMNNLLPKQTPTGKVRAQCRYDMLNASILLAQDSLDQAIEAYKNISTMDIPFAFQWNFLVINVPFEQDGLAQAYIQKGDLDNAISTYEKMITLDKDSRNWLIIAPIYHYRLAKLYEEKGWAEKAIKEYRSFIDIWKNADIYSQELTDARKRLANLSKERE